MHVPAPFHNASMTSSSTLGKITGLSADPLLDESAWLERCERPVWTHCSITGQVEE